MADLRITYGCPRCHGAPMFEDIDGHYQAAHPGKTYRQDRDVLAAPASQALSRLDAVGAERDRLAQQVLTDEQAEAVLVAHQRLDIGHCLCGWGELGRSHARHQVAMLRQAAQEAGRG